VSVAEAARSYLGVPHPNGPWELVPLPRHVCTQALVFEALADEAAKADGWVPVILEYEERLPP
jgi:hypothetical protein